MTGRVTMTVLIAMCFGCSVDEDQFLTEYVNAYCQEALTCLSASELAFNGWTNQEACVSDYGPTLTSEASDCLYNPEQSKECLKSTEAGLSCSAEGEVEFPIECEDVFTDCTVL